ncbi:MAG: helix-turn-helix transcriptional regulator [Bryobacteraceae bacterium]|nr:helix-turn-helix transcriptional regulator [Bryobacteraceae bacterium]
MQKRIFGPKVQRLRELLQLTQTGLGEKLGCPRITVAQWEGGKREPAPAFLLKLAALASDDAELAGEFLMGAMKDVGVLAALYASRASDDLRRARFTLETLLPDHEFFMKKSPEEMQKCIRDALNDLANAARVIATLDVRSESFGKPPEGLPEFVTVPGGRFV